MKTVIRATLAIVLSAALMTAVSGCGGAGLGEKFYDYKTPEPPDMEVLMLAQMMSGSFSNAAQAAADPVFHDVTLEVARIWTTSEDGSWLYVEQAAAGSKDKPYLQRVFHLLRRNPTVIACETYLLPDEAAMVGAWADPSRFDALTSAGLTVKEGCDVDLEQENEWTYAGTTKEHDCPSELQGAAYATNEVTLTPSWLKIWTRGYDEEGTQVWGNETGPTVFVKLGR